MEIFSKDASGENFRAMSVIAAVDEFIQRCEVGEVTVLDGVFNVFGERLKWSAVRMNINKAAKKHDISYVTRISKDRLLVLVTEKNPAIEEQAE